MPRKPHISASSRAALSLFFASQYPLSASLPLEETAPSKSCDVATSSSVATRNNVSAVPLGASAATSPSCVAARTPNPASCPPNPNVAPHGRFIHAGAFFIGCFGPGCCTPY